MSKEFVADLRHAADNPASWDIPGLLRDAANRIESLMMSLDVARGPKKAEPTSEQLIVAATAGAIYATCNRGTPEGAVAVARQIMAETMKSG